MKKKDDRSRWRIKSRPEDVFSTEPTVYYRDAGLGTFDDFVRRVNGKEYKYRRARLWLENNKGVKVRQVFYGRTDAELNKKIKAAKARPASDINPHKTTLEQWIELWLETSQEKKPNTLRHYKQNFEKHIRPRIGKAKIGKLIPQNFASFLKELKDDGIGASTVEVSYKILRAAFQKLHKDQVLDRNPVATVGKPRVPKPERRMPTMDEAKKLLKAAKGTRDYPLILMALLTSMRPGELFALRWKDVNLTQGFLTVNHTLTTDADGKLVLDDPKTPEARRRVELDHYLVAELTKLRKQDRAVTHVFTAPDGGLISKGNFRKRVWAPLLVEAKIPDLTLYSLRHFGNSLLAHDGASVKVLQARLGHTRAAMTLDTYTKLMPSGTREAANRLSDLFLGGLNGAKDGAKSKSRKYGKSAKILVR
ncbi:MAG: tyrosine-type recombinase/integrase [Candidatus Eremiobacteraeota bacterium]|nr:tyrosine-type recombinase/integrase [Candidatus Eremiobacteraeota bacterium]